MNPTPRLDLKIRPTIKETSFHFLVLPDTGCTTTVIFRYLQQKYKLPLYTCSGKLIASDDSELNCVGFTDIFLDKVKTKAIVMWSVKSDLIVGCRDLQAVGVIRPDFPYQSDKLNVLNAVQQTSLDRVIFKYKEVLIDVLPEQPLTGPMMKIKLTDNAIPFRATTTKAIPLHWQGEADRTLKKLLDNKVIEPETVEEPSDWIAPDFDLHALL